jgi:hypothetical protein
MGDDLDGVPDLEDAVLGGAAPHPAGGPLTAPGGSLIAAGVAAGMWGTTGGCLCGAGRGVSGLFGRCRIGPGVLAAPTAPPRTHNARATARSCLAAM